MEEIELEDPRELGLPKKFTAWRLGQHEIIRDICRSEKYVYFLDAPTGTGKSLIGVASYAKLARIRATIDRMKGESKRYRCVYVTRTKQLQEQILREFPMARTVVGRNNFPCSLHEDKFPEITAENCRSNCGHMCRYKIAKKAALDAPLAVLNEAYFLHEANGPGQFSGATLVIMDEVDSVEAALMSYIQFSVTDRQLDRLEIKPPEDHDSRVAWLEWLHPIRKEVGDRIETLEEHLEEIDDSLWSGVEIDLQKQLDRLKTFYSKLVMLYNYVDETWLFHISKDEKGKKWEFKPVMVAPYAHRFLWKHGDRFLGMSGTILDSTIQAQELGLDPEDTEYKQIASPFPVEHRLLYFSPVAEMTRKKMDISLPIMAGAINEIIARYPDEKVLIHTVSYKIRDYLVKALPKSRIITHSSSDREESLDWFRTTPDPLVMLSPSFDRGVDLPEDACRCIIICKVPYLDMSDPQVNARMRMPGGQRWYLTRAAQTMMQMSGRAVRSPDDYCDTYILDRQFAVLLARVRETFPEWWRAAIRRQG